MTFAYGPHAEPVIDDLHLSVPEGDHLAVVGPSGIGKSTLAALVTGTLRPGSGRILVGGVPAGDLDPAGRVLIPQEAYVFRGSLMENLTYLAPASAGAVEEAVAAVGLTALVTRLGGHSAGIHSGMLSPGERQLIALARAYLAPARLVILDEATCHLDPAAEARAEEAFVRRGGTLLVIAHRLTSALRARRILVMDGTSVLLGGHEEMLAASPLRGPGRPVEPFEHPGAGPMIYPPAERQPIVDDLHGRAVPDPYRWLEDPESPSTRSWLAAQDDLWRGHAATLPRRDGWRARVSELTGAGTVGAPLWRGGRRFFLLRTAGQEHAVLRTTGPDGATETLIDPMELDPSGLTTLDNWQPDLDGRLLAYQLSRSGDERSELRVMDVGTGRIVDGPIDRCRYSPVAWLPDGKSFYYVRSRQVCLHRLGTPAADDVVIRGADRSYGLGLSHSGRWLTISAASGGGNDLWLADLSSSSPSVRTCG
ncbi:ATP-binding cassette domain-containing protein [Streptosporangium lutulentum]